jgi:hypothetical protein
MGVPKVEGDVGAWGLKRERGQVFVEHGYLR